MKNLVVYIVLAVMSTACSSVQVITDYDTSANFRDYESFEIASVNGDLPDEPLVNELNLNRVKRAIVNEMLARGYEEKAQGEGDLSVNIYIKVETIPQSTMVYNGPYFPYYGRFRLYRHWGYYDYYGVNWVYSDVQTRNYKEGTLVVDLVDVKNSKLVWHGVATSTLGTFKKNPEPKINETISRMFKSYPYRMVEESTVTTVD